MKRFLARGRNIIRQNYFSREARIKREKDEDAKLRRLHSRVTRKHTRGNLSQRSSYCYRRHARNFVAAPLRWNFEVYVVQKPPTTLVKRNDSAFRLSSSSAVEFTLHPHVTFVRKQLHPYLSETNVEMNIVILVMHPKYGRKCGWESRRLISRALFGNYGGAVMTSRRSHLARGIKPAAWKD